MLSKLAHSADLGKVQKSTNGSMHPWSLRTKSVFVHKRALTGGPQFLDLGRLMIDHTKKGAIAPKEWVDHKLTGSRLLSILTNLVFAGSPLKNPLEYRVALFGLPNTFTVRFQGENHG